MTASESDLRTYLWGERLTFGNPTRQRNPPAPDPVEPSPPATPTSGDKVFQRTLRATVWVLVADRKNLGSGSGVLIDPEKRIVLTNYHVVEQHREAVVCFPRYENNRLVTAPREYVDRIGSLGIRGAVLARDPKVDLALIQLASLPPAARALPLAGHSAKQGQRIHAGCWAVA